MAAIASDALENSELSTRIEISPLYWKKSDRKTPVLPVSHVLGGKLAEAEVPNGSWTLLLWLDIVNTAARPGPY
jgi:hypothetical protein